MFDRWPRTQWIFWSSLGWVLLASLPVVALLHGLQRPSEIPLVAAAAAVMLGPVHLVFAWGLAVLRLWLQPTGSVQSHEFWALHRALGWSLLGGVIGLLLMLPALAWL